MGSSYNGGLTEKKSTTRESSMNKVKIQEKEKNEPISSGVGTFFNFVRTSKLSAGK